MPELNPLTNEQIFLKKIAENTGSNYNTGDVSEINPLTIDQIMLKEIAANTAGLSGDITELEGKVADNTSAIEKIGNVEAMSLNIGNNSTDPIYIPYYENGLYIVGSNNNSADGNLYIFSVLQGSLLMLEQKEIDGTGSTGVRLVFSITNDNKIQISNNGFWGAILNILIIHR